MLPVVKNILSGVIRTPQSKSLINNSVNLLSKRFYAWSIEREPNHKFKKASEIIREKEIFEALEKTKEDAKNPEVIKNILKKAKDRALLKNIVAGSEFVQGLNIEETATLLNMDSNNKELTSLLFKTAFDIKERIYGNRIVLFAPLYISNYCVNSCTYCSFRIQNTHGTRALLEKEDIIREVSVLQRQGHKRVLVLTGEHPKYPFEKFLEAIKIISEVKTPPCGEIRRINVEIPMLSVSDFRRLKNTNVIGTYTLFQETYHRETFKRVHPHGPKSNYERRVLTFDRAQTAGIDDVGLGVLFGLYDYKFEVLALLQHAQHLDKTYNAGPHTLSIPRIQPAANAPDAINTPYPVNDADFKKLVAILRCAVPYTGMILSTRESVQMRNDLLNMGISQMSAGSRTDVGAYHRDVNRKADEYTHPNKKYNSSSQFTLNDPRNTDQVINDLIKSGYVPSFCTACYREGRTGEAFMNIAKKGDIHNFCHPNALLTLQEYLTDYASDKTRENGFKLIEKEEKLIPSKIRLAAFKKKQKRLEAGERDLYF